MDDSISLAGSDRSSLAKLTAEIVSAYVSNNPVPIAELPTLLSGIHAAITGLGSAAASAEPQPERLTPTKIRKSITDDALISFIDGKPYKTLKRHLTTHGLTMDQYRERYGLPRDYPSTAASYSAARSALARSAGLGQRRRKASSKAAEGAETIAEAPETRSRKKATATAEKPSKARRARKAAAAE